MRKQESHAIAQDMHHPTFTGERHILKGRRDMEQNFIGERRLSKEEELEIAIGKEDIWNGDGK